VKKAVVLVVEKDRALVTEAIRALQEAGYEVIIANDTAEGLKMLYLKDPDVVIASTDLSSVNGEDACQRLRQASYLPLIAIGSSNEVVEMLELGMDACIIGPPSGREVVARVDSLIRRRGNDSQAGGGSRSDINDYLPGGKDKPGGLSPTECHLSACLLSNEGRLLEYPRLITEVWGGKKVSRGTLHFYMRRLRRKLADFNIFSVRGVGYGISRSNK
jgi:DNA-binding response OmpR family regulator